MSSAGRSPSDRPFCFLLNTSIGIGRSARRCLPTRVPTSPTVISMSCCWPRSIVQCSGSALLRGGSTSGSLNLPKSSATPGRLKFSKTGCLTQKFSSTSCRMFGGRPQVWKWRERVRSAHVLSAFLPPPQRLQRQGGGNGSGQQRPSCRLSSCLPAPSPTLDRRCPRWRSTGQRRLRLSAAADGRYSYPAQAGQITLAVGDERQPSELMLSQNGRDVRAARIAEVSWQGVEADAKPLDSYVGWYQLAPNRVLTVTRDGDRMVVHETGRPKFAVTAHGADAFSSNHDDLVIFLRDGQAKVSQVLLQEPTSGARLAPRVDVAKARMIEEEFARRIAEVPDRFREQAPLPGSKEAVLRGIADMQRGAPNYDRMSASLAAKVRREASQTQSMFKALGAVESTFFRGVGPGGYDIYGVKFANGFAEFRLLLGTDGKADDVIFRPDGNGTPGGVAACSGEQGLKSQGDTAPIKLLLYNGTGTDIQLYKLDTEGKRIAQGMIGDNMSSSVLAYIDSPWVIADASGTCLEIVLPGQRTRLHTVERSPADHPPGHSAPPRTAPLAESEAMLRQYIEALGRGEPNYDRMTSEVAAQTRQQLPFNQAIVTRLGALRAVSFRGVSPLGSDVYMAHFANGSAEWRIGLVKDGTIGRIALGPQY